MVVGERNIRGLWGSVGFDLIRQAEEVRERCMTTAESLDVVTDVFWMRCQVLFLRRL